MALSQRVKPPTAEDPTLLQSGKSEPAGHDALLVKKTFNLMVDAAPAIVVTAGAESPLGACVPAGTKSVGRVKLAKKMAVAPAAVSTEKTADAPPALVVVTVMAWALFEKVPAYPALLVALLRYSVTGTPCWMFAAPVRLNTTLTVLPANWHGFGAAGTAAPHVPGVAAPFTVGIWTANGLNVEVTMFPLDPAAANDGAVLVAPAVSRPFAP